jgi:hypothetical protein
VLGTLVLIVGYGVAVIGGGAFVERALQRILGDEDRETISAFRHNGLRGGGKMIGWLERFLFVTFVLAGSHAAAALVLAAKGVVLYGTIKDARNQKVAEYVLIGTMLSLAWALTISIFILNLTG